MLYHFTLPPPLPRPKECNIYHIFVFFFLEQCFFSCNLVPRTPPVTFCHHNFFMIFVICPMYYQTQTWLLKGGQVYTEAPQMYVGINKEIQLGPDIRQSKNNFWARLGETNSGSSRWWKEYKSAVALLRMRGKWKDVLRGQMGKVSII